MDFSVSVSPCVSLFIIIHNMRHSVELLGLQRFTVKLFKVSELQGLRAVGFLDKVGELPLGGQDFEFKSQCLGLGACHQKENHQCRIKCVD